MFTPYRLLLQSSCTEEVHVSEKVQQQIELYEYIVCFWMTVVWCVDELNTDLLFLSRWMDSHITGDIVLPLLAHGK